MTGAIFDKIIKHRAKLNLSRILMHQQVHDLTIEEAVEFCGYPAVRAVDKPRCDLFIQLVGENKYERAALMFNGRFRCMGFDIYVGDFNKRRKRGAQLSPAQVITVVEEG